MKKRIWIGSVLLVALLLATASASAGQSPAKITGSMNLEPDWGDYYFRVWVNFNVHEVDPSTHEADGVILARVYNETLGTKRLWLEPECASFGDVNGNPAAVVVGTIVRREGWDDVPGAGDPGEYFRWQVLDAGTPGGNGDAFSIDWYDYANFIEYWPMYPAGGCTTFQADSTEFADHGNLVIHY